MLNCTKKGTLCTLAKSRGYNIGCYCDDWESCEISYGGGHIKLSDKKKRQWHLLPMKQLEDVLATFEQSLETGKYTPFGWKTVPNLKQDKTNAAMRHLVAYMNGEQSDPESGLSHMAHVAANALMVLWSEHEERGNGASN